jgi:hypothetical protein
MSRGRSGSTRVWRKARAAQLARRPWCEDCGRRPAVEVDHVAGWRADPGHALLASVCHDCHAKRTTRQLRRRYPPPRRTTI